MQRGGEGMHAKLGLPALIDLRLRREVQTWTVMQKNGRGDRQSGGCPERKRKEKRLMRSVQKRRTVQRIPRSSNKEIGNDSVEGALNANEKKQNLCILVRREQRHRG